MKKEKIEEWDWRKDFHEKFDKEVHYAVLLQLEKFISEVRVDAIGIGCKKAQKEMLKNLKI